MTRREANQQRSLDAFLSCKAEFDALLAELQQASADRRPFGQQDGWAHYGSTTAKGEIHLAAGGPEGPWLLAIDHPGVIAEFGQTNANVPWPGRARYAFSKLGELYGFLARVYALAVSLPDAPLQTFVAKTKDLPRATETERLVVQRIGQDIFRNGLMAYWGGRCPLTGITKPA